MKEENQTIIKAINMFGRVPEQYELLEEIEKLNKESKILRENAEHNDKVVDKVNWENKRLNNIINKAKEKSIFLQKRYGYVLDDLTYLLMQGSDSNE